MSRVNPAIVIDGLVKDYGETRAVNGLSLDVREGEIFALLGPNGAGKTTTVEILEGYRHPDAGTVSVLGLNPVTESVRLKPFIGVMLQEGGLYQAITAREALDLFAHFYSNPRDPSELLQAVGLVDAAHTRYRQLSGGQKQRLSLALALVGRPRLVFLDEPTGGLDPQARRTTWDIIRNLRDGGITVLLTTHYLEEAERLADRVAIINEGHLVALGSPDSLLRADATLVRLRTARPVSLDWLAALPASRSARDDDTGGYVIETSDAPELLAQITASLATLGVLATELRVGQGTLEELFLSLTGKEVRV